jgi:general secretion pathway protein G
MVRRAFTLMEMLVVVAIIVVLAGVGGYYYMNAMDTAKVKAAKGQVQILTQAAQTYELDNGSWPADLGVLLQPNPLTGKPYLENADAVITPWQTPYRYDPSGQHNNRVKPDIWAEGPNGLVIGNWSSH